MGLVETKLYHEIQGSKAKYLIKSNQWAENGII